MDEGLVEYVLVNISADGTQTLYWKTRTGTSEEDAVRRYAEYLATGVNRDSDHTLQFQRDGRITFFVKRYYAGDLKGVLALCGAKIVTATLVTEPTVKVQAGGIA